MNNLTAVSKLTYRNLTHLSVSSYLILSRLTQSVKKNTMLPKRLYRLSEIWLLEYKDWDGFQKKFKLLVVDYIMKFLSANSNNNNGA